MLLLHLALQKFLFLRSEITTMDNEDHKATCSQSDSRSSCFSSASNKQLKIKHAIQNTIQLQGKVQALKADIRKKNCHSIQIQSMEAILNEVENLQMGIERIKSSTNREFVREETEMEDLEEK